MNFANCSLVGISGQYVPENLKRDLLLYDKVGVYQIDKILELSHVITKLSRDPGWGECVIKSAHDSCSSLEFLYDRDCLFEFSEFLSPQKLKIVCNPHEDSFGALFQELNDLHKLQVVKDSSYKKFGVDDLAQIPKDLSLESMVGLLNELESNILKKYMDNNAIVSLFSRLSSAIIKKHYRLPSHSINNASWLTSPNILCSTNTEVLNVVLSKIPFPHENTPLERILDFRQEQENKDFLAGLRVWIHEASKENVSPIEISDRIDWMIAERKRHLEKEKLAYSYGTLGTVIVGAANVAEKLVKVKWGELAKDTVKLFDQRANLLKAELETPNPELHYILKLQNEFE